jgi:hypothetical protein
VGRAQARDPKSCITAGANSIRTKKASTNTPIARANAMGLMLGSPSGTKAAKTASMITAAAVTTRELPTKPSAIARCASFVRVNSSFMRAMRNTS